MQDQIANDAKIAKELANDEVDQIKQNVEVKRLIKVERVKVRVANMDYESNLRGFGNARMPPKKHAEHQRRRIQQYGQR